MASASHGTRASGGQHRDGVKLRDSVRVTGPSVRVTAGRGLGPRPGPQAFSGQPAAQSEHVSRGGLLMCVALKIYDTLLANSSVVDSDLCRNTDDEGVGITAAATTE